MKTKSLKVDDLMTTGVITLKASDTVESARTQMDFASIRHLPVVDDRNHVIGILSNRDLGSDSKHGRTKRVADVMSRTVRTVRPTTSAAAAVALLLEHKIGSLPVIGDDGQLVGVITETDFLTVAHAALKGLSPAERAEA